MDQLTELLREGMELYMERNRRPDEGRQVDAAGKMPAAQGGNSEEQMEVGEEMPSNRGSLKGLQLLAAEKRPEAQRGASEEEIGMLSNRMPDEGLQLHAAEKRPEVQEGDSEEVMGMPSNRMSDEGLQLHAAEKRPEVQGGDSDVMDAVMRSEILRIVMQSMQPGVHKEMLAKLLEYEEENQPHKQQDQLQKQKLLQNLMQSIQPSDQKEKLAKLLRYEEGNEPPKQDNQQQKLENQPPKQDNQQQKQENQPRKQNKKHHRKSRMALRKVEMDKVKKEKAPPREDKAAAYLAKWAKERESEPESEASSDLQAYEARLCRDSWNDEFAASGHYGTYETITSIPPMRFTDCLYEYAGPRESLQIFSIKVVETKKGVDWPLCVYGKIAVRDTVDHNRNVVFDRTRDNYQTITKESPYLTLTGPCRAAVLSVRHSYIEAELKIKDSSSDSDDTDFSYLATGYLQNGLRHSSIVKRVLSSKVSTLELIAGHIVNSVEATINVEVSSGKWPSGHGGELTVSTRSMEAMEIVLLAFGDGGMPVEDDDGKRIRLSRRVVGVEVDGGLKFSAKALLPASRKVALSDEQVFTPKEAGRSHMTLKMGSCEMKVTVAWSLLLTYDE